jgi:hypothetical protein
LCSFHRYYFSINYHLEDLPLLAFVVGSIFLLAFNALVALEAVHHAIPQLSKQYRL